MADVIHAFVGTRHSILVMIRRLREHRFVMDDLWHLREQVRGGDEVHRFTGLVRALPAEHLDELVELLHKGQEVLNPELRV